MPHHTRQDCRSTLFSAPLFTSKAASRWLAGVTIARLLNRPKTVRRGFLSALAVFTIWSAGLQECRAELIFFAEEVGSDVVVSWGGAGSGVDLTGQSILPGGPIAFGPRGIVGPAAGSVQGNVGFVNMDAYNLGPALSGFGPGPSSGNVGLAVLSGGGPQLAVSGAALYVQTGYLNESNFAPISVTFSGASFDTLGITPTNAVLLDWGDSSPNTRISMTFAVPEPTTALALLGLVTSAFFRRRRRVMA